MNIGIEATRIGKSLSSPLRRALDLIFSSKYHNLNLARVIYYDNTGYLPGDPEVVIPHGLTYPPMFLMTRFVANVFSVDTYECLAGDPSTGNSPVEIDERNIYIVNEFRGYIILFFEPTNEKY